MHNKYQHLFSPIKIGNIVLKNRIEMSPTAIPDNRPSGFSTFENKLYYDTKARSGAGLIVHDEMTVHYTSGGGEGADFDRPARVIVDMRQDADTVHRHGAVSSLSLNHYGGWVNMKYAVDGGKIYGPSAIINPYGLMTTEMSEDLIMEIAEEFGKAACMAQFSGHDMCQIHGAHGWLISQFLSPAQNKRKDKFGGSLENRARFPLLVIDAIRRWTQNFPIEYRFSAEDYLENGFSFDEAVEFARMLDGKVDLIHVSTSSFWDPTCGNLFPSMFTEHSLNASIAAAIKKAIKTPVAVVGAHQDLAYMDEIIASGQADILAVGRGFMADPFWAEKAYYGREDDITPCVRCNYCVHGAYEPANYTKYHVHLRRCTVNPALGKEHYRFSMPQTTKKKILIIGGGPGGMQAAITAADRGHEVILCEQNDRLGGMLNTIIGLPFKGDYRRFLEVMIRRIEQRPIEVRLNTAVTPELAAKIAPDVIFAAIGAKPIIPNIPGIDNQKVLTVANIRQAELLQNIVIIGGGTTGAEEALALAQEGKNVTVIELRNDIGLGAPYLHYQSIKKEFQKEGAPHVLLNSQCTKITSDGVYIRSQDGQESFIEADNILIAAGVEPLRDDAELFRPCAMELRLIGDCRRGATISEAVEDAYECAYGL